MKLCITEINVKHECNIDVIFLTVDKNGTDEDFSWVIEFEISLTVCHQTIS